MSMVGCVPSVLLIPGVLQASETTAPTTQQVLPSPWYWVNARVCQGTLATALLCAPYAPAVLSVVATSLSRVLLISHHPLAPLLAVHAFVNQATGFSMACVVSSAMLGGSVSME